MLASNFPTTTTPTLHKPLHSKVSNYLNAQRRDGSFCDLVLELDETKLFGHFCVIAAQSRFIGGMNSQQSSYQFSIQNPLQVTIKNFDCPECLRTIMDFFYEDIVTVTTEHEQHFKNLARILVVEELVNIYDIPNKLVVILQGETEKISINLTEDLQLEEKSTPEENIAKSDDSIFEQRNFFKLKNPRAVSSSSKINYCIGCDFKCYRVHDMIEHMTLCEDSHLTCSLCEVGFRSWRDYDLHLKKHSVDLQKPFFCLECDVRFNTRASLLVHYPKHSVEAPHTCPECHKGFKWKHGLTSHLHIHNKEKQMLCDVCGYSTTHMKALKSHKLQHTGEYFKCTYDGCNHRANRKENLKLHMETHTQERKYVCEVCGYKFSQSKNLKRHALKHAVGDINKFKCQLCSFSSHRSDKLKEHVQRVHTEKAVQLELPEIVENSFQCIMKDEFDLPDTMGRDSVTPEEVPTKRPRVRRKRNREIAKGPLRPLQPKECIEFDVAPESNDS